MFDIISQWLKERNRVFRTAIQVIGASVFVGVLTAGLTMVESLELSDPVQLALVSVVTVLLSSWMKHADKMKDDADAAFEDACDDLE